MKYVAPTLLLLLFLMGIHYVLGQGKFITVSGKITDAQTHEPIPFVNLQLKSKGTGTATNAEGAFVFKIPESQLEDTLLVSCVGYKTLSRPLRYMGSNVSITLEPAVVELAEVTINAPNGLDILKKTLAKIPVNYDTSDVRFTAFYREHVWLEDFELAFSEAVLNIYKTFKTEKKLNDQFSIIKGRKKSIDYGREGQLYYWMSGASNGVRGSLSEDMVKYNRAKWSPFNPANFKHYDYEYAESIKDGNSTLIVLNIVPKKNSRKGILLMKVFIDEESLAIVKYNFELSKQGIRFVSRKDQGILYAIMTKIVHATRDYHKFQYTVSYSQHNSKWYLKRVTRHWEILVNSKKRNWVDKLWIADMDLIMTDINTENVKPISEGDISENKGPIHSVISADFDEQFWENYNFLKSETTDSARNGNFQLPEQDTIETIKNGLSNRPNGFTRADTLRGKLTSFRTCYDVTFYHLDVAVNMDDRSISGNNLIQFDVKQPFQKMQIDLYENMEIDKILYKNQQLAYTREYNAVFIDFPRELQVREKDEIKIYYHGVPKMPDWSIPMNGGILWDKDSLGNPWVQMVCQGSGASLWWPNKDHQSDEPDSMKIWVTVPAAFTEISNGRLIRTTPMPGNQSRFEWEVSYPINNYNVTFNIGKYAHFEDVYVSDDTLTIDYYVMPYNLERSKKMFQQVGPMMECFEKNFGKYPFKRDGFTLVESLYPMEHQSGVCIGKITEQTSGDTNPLLWHESAHEWWGNAITCKDIADMWIHEAFATYAEYQVIEHRFGKEIAYQAIQEQLDAVLNEQPVIGVYDVNHIYYDIGDMYSKGSLMLHTFRNVLNNDTLWVHLLHDIQNEFRYKTLSSDDLVSYINQRTKTDYTYFFNQYLNQVEIPTLEIQLTQQQNDLIVRYRWEANVKDFRMPAKVTTAANHFEFIYPTTEWRSITLKNLNAHEFDVNLDEFYIDVDIN